MRKLNTADKSMIKEINTKAIFKIIRDFGPISRADISKRLNLTPVTVSANVMTLIEENLVEEVGAGESKGGRKPVLLELNAEARVVIGVDMGIEKVEVGMVNIAGEILNATTYKYSTFGGDIFKTIEIAVKDIIVHSDVEESTILGIGMGVHGIVDSEKGLSVFAPAFDWHDKDIVTHFEQLFDLPVRIENDARAMALAERWFGRGREVDHFILVNIGEGVGSGIYINGELFKGMSSGAGEVGHVAVSSGDYACECGARGCLTTVASAKGIVKRYATIERISEGGLTAERVYLRALAGDSHAVMVFKKTGEYIGKALSILVNLFNPQIIILTGGVSRSFDLMAEVVDDVVRHQSLNHNAQKVVIVESEMCESGGVIGAATLFIESLFVTSNFRM